MSKIRKPDVLTTFAHLSSDLIYTSPQYAKLGLNLLPNDIWRDKNIKILDPVCKSGSFLREATSKLIEGLEGQFKNKQDTINHILTKQIYGISCESLTALITRRTLYCSRVANGTMSICSGFDNEDGNIHYQEYSHHWVNGQCKYCGASLKKYDRDSKLEQYAFPFIHTEKPDKIFDVKFDIIIGNPPYQLEDDGAGRSAKLIFHHFVNQAKKLNPKYLIMIIPSRWFTGGKGMDSFRETMLNDKRIRMIHDFPNSKDVFPGPSIRGGVCYFLWDRDNEGDCEVTTHIGDETNSMTRPLKFNKTDVFIRDNKAIPIVERVVNSKNFENIKKIISSRKPFGLETTFSDYTKTKQKDLAKYCKIFANKNVGFIERKKVIQNNQWIDKFKVLVPYAIGSGDSRTDKVNPILAELGTCCTETYLVFGPLDKKECENLISYINTKFFHFMLGIKKNTQHTTAQVYEFVPKVDLTKAYNDKILFDLYSLSEEERSYIEETVISASELKTKKIFKPIISDD